MQYYKKTLLDSLLAEPKRTTFNIAEMTSRPVTAEILKATQPDGFPLPHGKDYEDTTSLVADVFKRCRVEGYDDIQATKFAVMVLEQFEGSPA